VSLVTQKISRIADLAETMKRMPQIESPVQHTFSDGVYAREVTMCEGSCVVGKIHKTNHLNIIVSGECTVITAARHIKIKAPYTFESFAGEQKVVYMHSEVVWITIHKTESTDLAIIEEECISKEYDEKLIAKLTHKLQDRL
jgi:hypothetical protein